MRPSLDHPVSATAPTAGSLTFVGAQRDAREHLRRSLALVLALAGVVWLLPSATSWAYVEVDALVEDTVQPRSLPGLQPAAVGAVASTAVHPEHDFSMVGAHAPVGATVDVRVQDPTGAWSRWMALPFEDDHEGDDGHESSEHEGLIGSDPIFVDHGVALQVRVTGAVPEQVAVTVLDAHGRTDAEPERIRVPAAQAEAADDRPDILTRDVWGAAAPRDDIVHATAEWYEEDDEDDAAADAPYVDRGPAHDLLGAAVIHHTASPSSYSADEVAGIIRGMQRYHQTGRGWDDIGYNFIVDRFGRIWEGRDGGVDRAVVGAHAGGWNATSFGVALIGDFRGGSMPTTDQLDAAVDLIAWKFVLHRVDPNDTHTWPNGGTRPTLIGHSDVRQTTCPGGVLALLPQIRNAVADAMVGLEVERPWEDEQAPTPAPSFRDVDPDDPDAAAIIELATLGVIRGCTGDSYCPEEAVTRGQIASLFAKAFELPSEEGDPPFADVAPNSPHRDWIRSLVDHGAITGFPDGTYRATIPITRVQAAAIIGRTLGIQPTEGGVFADLQTYGSALGGWAVALSDAGVMRGCAPELFCPTVEVSRAELATLLSNALSYAEDRQLAIGG